MGLGEFLPLPTRQQTETLEVVGRVAGRAQGTWVAVTSKGWTVGLQAHGFSSPPVIFMLGENDRLDKYPFTFPVILMAAQDNQNIPRMCYLLFLPMLSFVS